MLRSVLQGFPLLFSRSYWRNGFSLVAFIKALFVAFGAFWLIQPLWEILSDATKNGFRPYWWILPSLATCYALREVWPTRRVECRLEGRDISIGVEVGDLFATNDALVIASNRTFDTDTATDLISPNSVQGQYTAKYYNAIAHLDVDLANALAGEPFVEDAAKLRGKKRVYEVGSVAKLRAQGRSAYFVALATMNQHGVAGGTLDDVRAALAKLWQFIADKGGEIAVVRMPVIGTGFTRIVETRETIVREIIQSFVAACAQRRFCEGLTVVVSPGDYRRYDISLNELERFLRHICRYSEFKRPSDPGRGTALPV